MKSVVSLTITYISFCSEIYQNDSGKKTLYEKVFDPQKLVNDSEEDPENWSDDERTYYHVPSNDDLRKPKNKLKASKGSDCFHIYVNEVKVDDSKNSKVSLFENNLDDPLCNGKLVKPPVDVSVGSIHSTFVPEASINYSYPEHRKTNDPKLFSRKCFLPTANSTKIFGIEVKFPIVKRSSTKRNFIESLFTILKAQNYLKITTDFNAKIISLPSSKAKKRNVSNVDRQFVKIVKPPEKKLKFVKMNDISTDVTKRDDSSAHDEILSESTTDPADENFFDLTFKIIESKLTQFKMKSCITSGGVKYNAGGQEIIQFVNQSANCIRNCLFRTI